MIIKWRSTTHTKNTKKEQSKPVRRPTILRHIISNKHYLRQLLGLYIGDQTEAFKCFNFSCCPESLNQNIH